MMHRKKGESDEKANAVAADRLEVLVPRPIEDMTLGPGP